MRCLLVMLCCFAGLASGLATAQDFDLPVDVERVLAVDGSGSMDYEEHTVQRQGYVQALGHPDFVRAALAGGFQRVGLTYGEWAGPERHAVVMPWTVVADDDALRISDFLATAPTNFMRGTSISSISPCRCSTTTASRGSGG